MAGTCPVAPNFLMRDFLHSETSQFYSSPPYRMTRPRHCRRHEALRGRAGAL